MLTASYSQAQVSVRVGVGASYGYVGAAPICSYGYYDYYPYECAPYGFYGSDYFVGDVFIGAGPWYRGYYGRRSISVGTAIERAPFLPTARTAKKWLSVETPFKTVSPGEAAKS